MKLNRCLMLKHLLCAGLFILGGQSVAASCTLSPPLQGHWHSFKKGECHLAQKIAYWSHLDSNPRATFEDLTAFFHANPTWPNQIALKIKAEEAINASTSPKAMYAWFKTYPPVRACGALAFVKIAHTKADENSLRNVFKTVAFSAHELKTFIAYADAFLQSGDFLERFDILLHKNDIKSATELLTYIPKHYQKTAQARLALAKASCDGNARIKRDPSLTSPGYIWQYGVYLRKTKQYAALSKYLASTHVKQKERKNPILWWDTIRRFAVRHFVEEGQHALALAAIQVDILPKDTSEYAEAKWLQGWIRLHFLHQSKQALNDFKQLYNAAKTPLYMSRAAYWAARAARKSAPHCVNDWLKKAAMHPALFYGQLAYSTLGRTSFTPKHYAISAQKRAAFDRLETVRVIKLLKKAGRADLTHLFFWKLGLSMASPEEHEHLIRLASDVDGAYTAVQVTKIGARRVMPDIDAAFPRLNTHHIPRLPKFKGVNVPALVHAIIRQESRFNDKATSHKGARGLMQVLDGTAKDVARREGISFKDLYHPKSNIALGNGYIQELLKKYDGSLLLAIAAYNAGPGNVNKWIEKYGRPNAKKGFDAVEWIQMIPFKETRFYVERVLENYWRYAIVFEKRPIKMWHKMLT